MKLLHNVPAITKAVILAGLMSSCQNEKDAVVSPENTLEQVTNANAKTAVTYLIKDGGTKLTYSGIRNLITKELDGTGLLKEYSYNGNTITCDLKKNGVTINKNFITYTLNAKGQCVQSVHTQTDKVIGGTYIYVYNELNQLTSVYHKTLPKLRQVFEYEEDGDHDQASLRKITFYDQYDAKEKEILFQYANGYTDANNQKDFGLETNPLNPEGFAEVNSKYLQIFGKFSRYTLRQTVHKAFVGQVIYPYPVFNYSMYGSGSSTTEGINNFIFVTKNESGKILSKVERKYSTNPQPVMIGL